MRAHPTRKLLLALLLLTACGRGGEEPGGQNEEMDTSSVAPPPAPLTDNQALDVLLALSSAGVEAASIMPEQIGTPEVRRYLGVVRADHTALEAELKLLADTLQLVAEQHEAGDRVRAAAREAQAGANQQSPGQADGVALAQHVRFHTVVLGVLDSAVLRGPRQPLLAQYAAAVRPTVSAHLQRARQLQRLLAAQSTAPARSRDVTPTAAPIDTPPRPRPPAVVTGRPRPDTTVRS